MVQAEQRVWTDTSPHPWRRYFARMLDTLANGCIVIFVVAMILAIAHYPTYEKFQAALDNKFGATIVTSLAAMSLNALLIGLTGGSLGKWLFGVRVLRIDGSTIGFKAALKREVLVWVRGMGVGFPIVSLFTLVTAFNTLRKAGRSSWDSEMALKVVHRPNGAGQVIGIIVGFATFIGLLAGLSAL